MALTADRNGKASGKLTVPAHIPVGTVPVVIIGDQGSKGSTTYTGTHKITTSTYRRVTTVTYNYDPLAQTFTLNEGRHIGGVDLWFYDKGDSLVQIQIRETTAGFPNRNVLAQAEIQPDDINLNGTATRITFPPVWLEANEEYALVILTDDARTALSIAELGQYDSNTQDYVTRQPYQTGVLLSSSNASTWTSHQSMDLAFRLLACRFTETEYIYNLGTTQATNLTDLIILAGVEKTSANTNVEFILTDENGNEHVQTEDMGVQLQSEINGQVSVKMKLKGNNKESPVVYQGVQIGLGTQANTGDYVTRAIPAGNGSKVTVTFEAYTPGNSTVRVYYQDADSTWQLIPLKEGNPVGSGVTENIYEVLNFNQQNVKIKLVLNGSAQYRPYVKNLKVITV